ncbi:MAG: hypothetical protein ABWX90_01345 [Candidatus Saccharimonadales bacterium]
MIRSELHRLRTTLGNLSRPERTAYGALIVSALVFFGGLIYYFSPFDVAAKHVFFALIVIVVFGLMVIAYTHENSSDKDRQPRRVIPPKPISPPTISMQTKPIETIQIQRIREEISRTPPPKRRGRRPTTYRELVTQNGVQWLIIHSYTPIPQGAFKKKLWKHKLQKIELDNSRYVNTKLATRIPIIPTNDEEKIYCLTRLHWWSHGPAQIGVTAATLVMIAIVTSVGLTSADDNVNFGTLIFILLIAIAGGVWYFIVWMQWGYKYLVFTNRKIRLLYRPPFNLRSSTPHTDLVSLEGGINPSSSWWGNMWGYGSIKTETIATVVDSWLLKEVSFVPYYEQLAGLLSQLREDAIKDTMN